MLKTRWLAANCMSDLFYQTHCQDMHNALHCMAVMHFTELHCNDLHVCDCAHISAQPLNSKADFEANTYVVNAGS